MFITIKGKVNNDVIYSEESGYFYLKYPSNIVDLCYFLLYRKDKYSLWEITRVLKVS